MTISQKKSQKHTLRGNAKKTGAEGVQTDPLNIHTRLFDEIPSPILILNSEDLSIKYVNKAASDFYGYNKKTFESLNISQIEVPQTLSPKISFYNKQKRFSACHKLKDGTVRNLEVFSCRNSLFNVIVLYINNAGDDSKTISEKERQLDEMKTRFLSTSSHEFRTPLTTIFTSSELLLLMGRSISEEKYVDYIVQIQNAVTYMTGLLDDILTINKTEIGKWKFSPTKIDLYNFSTKMIEEAESIGSYNHKIKLQYELKTKQMIVDGKLLQHILSNLLSNAVKYSSKRKNIVFRIRGLKSDLEFSITDNGIGISKQDQKNLFETFYRGSNTGKIEGTGLGLSIVKRCVESHGGKITFKSGLNKGSTFVVTIPMLTVI